jgi:hypothetical protein
MIDVLAVTWFRLIKPKTLLCFPTTVIVIISNFYNMLCSKLLSNFTELRFQWMLVWMCFLQWKWNGCGDVSVCLLFSKILHVLYVETLIVLLPVHLSALLLMQLLSMHGQLHCQLDGKQTDKKNLIKSTDNTIGTLTTNRINFQLFGPDWFSKPY